MTWMPDDRTPVHCVQLQEELDWLLGIYRKMAPRRMLEIGAHAGGTLWHWMYAAEPGAHFTVVSLDATPHIPLWISWANERGHGLEVRDADSTEAESVAWMGIDAPYDFAFIDGSHAYDDVRQDWANVRKLMRKGGVVAFHDITDSAIDGMVGVPRLWREIKANKKIKTDEKIALPDQFCGIGVVYL